MDGFRFDRLTMRLSRRQTSRRVAMRLGGASLAALAGIGKSRRELDLGAVSLAQEATPIAIEELDIDGAWLCNQTFALCTTAPCAISESDPTIANCDCVVVNDFAIGFKTCTERAQSGAKLVSNFSSVNVNSEFAVMTCPADAPWANCLDMPCEIDVLNPAQALCQCEMVETGPSLTWGGGCDTSTCTSVIWSAAPPTYLGLAQYEEGMQHFNQEVTLPSACPAGAPVASPASATPAA